MAAVRLLSCRVRVPDLQRPLRRPRTAPDRRALQARHLTSSSMPLGKISRKMRAQRAWRHRPRRNAGRNVMTAHGPASGQAAVDAPPLQPAAPRGQAARNPSTARAAIMWDADGPARLACPPEHPGKSHIETAGPLEARGPWAGRGPNSRPFRADSGWLGSRANPASRSAAGG